MGTNNSERGLELWQVAEKRLFENAAVTPHTIATNKANAAAKAAANATYVKHRLTGISDKAAYEATVAELGMSSKATVAAYDYDNGDLADLQLMFG